jgi:thioesterase domain-containing protein
LTALRDFTVLPYPGKLTLYRAGDVPDFAEFDATVGWGAVALEGVDVDFVPGDHISMFKQPNVTSLAQRLQKKLQRSEPVVTRN